MNRGQTTAASIVSDANTKISGVARDLVAMTRVGSFQGAVDHHFLVIKQLTEQRVSFEQLAAAITTHGKEVSARHLAVMFRRARDKAAEGKIAPRNPGAIEPANVIVKPDDFDIEFPIGLPEESCLLSMCQDMSMLAGRSASEVENYFATHTSTRPLTDEAYFMGIADALKPIQGEDSPFGPPGSPRRLYALLILQSAIETEIDILTRPALAECVRIELPNLGRSEYNGRCCTDISTFDGRLYVRAACVASGYCEIGSPAHYIHTTPEWLEEVLASVEATRRFYGQIVMTDPVLDARLKEVYTRRGWVRAQNGVGLEFNSLAAAGQQRRGQAA